MPVPGGYLWADDSGEESEQLYAAGDVDGITALSLRTWAAAGADPVAREQVRGPRKRTSGRANTNGPTRPPTTG